MTLRRYSGVAMTSIRSSSGTVTRSCSIRCAAGAEHRLAIGVEGGVEVGRLVALDPVDDRGLVGVRVDLARGRGARGLAPPPAAPSRAPGSRRRRARRRRAGRPARRAARGRSPSRPCRPGACPRARPRTGRSRSWPTRSRARGGAVRAGRQDVRRRRRRSRRRRPAARAAVVDLDLLPAADLRDGRAGLGLLEVGRDRLEPAGDRVEPLGERRVVAREQQEQAVADVVERERPPLPDPQPVDVEDRAADVVDLEVALEARPRATARPGRSPRPRPGARARPRARRGRPRGCRRRAGRRPGGGRRDVARTGLSRMSRTKRVSTRS